MNRILEYCLPIFSLAEEFKVNFQQLSIEFREGLIQAFNVLDVKAKENGLEIADAKYALVAFIDELALHQEWQDRLLWMVKPLQVELFGEHLAGEGFFKRLEQLRQHPQRNIDTLEIYYICLELGFAGIYQLHGLEHLQAIRVNLADQIQLLRGKQDYRLEIIDQQALIANKQIHFEISGNLMLTSTFLLCFLLYGIAQIQMSHQTHFLFQPVQRKESLV